MRRLSTRVTALVLSFLVLFGQLCFVLADDTLFSTENRKFDREAAIQRLQNEYEDATTKKSDAAEDAMRKFFGRMENARAKAAAGIDELFDTNVYLEDTESETDKADENEEQENLRTGPDDDLTNSIIPLYAITHSKQDVVSASTGELTRYESLVYLQGNNGMDLSLDLMYDSGRAWYSNDVLSPYGSTGTHYKEYEVAAGWGYDLPYISGNHLYLPAYGHFEIQGNGIFQNHVAIAYLTYREVGTHKHIYTKDGTDYDFVGSNSSYHIYQVTDRYGNTLTYQYQNQKLSLIQDGIGRTVTIQKNTISSTLWKITLTLPNGETVDLNIEKIVPTAGDTGGTLYGESPNQYYYSDYVTILPSITRHCGSTMSYTSYYQYTFEGGYCYDGTYNAWNDYVPCALLSYSMNAEGGETYYTYDHTLCRSQGVEYTAYRVTVQDIRSLGGAYSDYITFTYTGNHTFGYTNNGGWNTQHYFYSVLVNGDKERINYEYEVTVGSNDVKSYDLTKTTYQSTNPLTIRCVTEYDFTEGMSYPSEVSTTYTSGNVTETLTEKYEYDAYKNVTKYTSPKAMGSTDALYAVFYVYDNPYAYSSGNEHHYNNLLSTTYKTDAYTTVQIVNTLTSDNKSIAETSTLVNAVEKERTRYTYDSYGHVLTEKRYSVIDAQNDANSVYQETDYSYTDPVNTVLNGVALKKVSKILGNSTIDTSYTYDIMGNVLSVTDPGGYVTTNTYDTLGRITEKELANGADICYTYYTESCVVRYNTLDGYTRAVAYDGFGHLAFSSKLNAQGQAAAIELYSTHMTPDGYPMENYIYTPDDREYTLGTGYDRFRRYTGFWYYLYYDQEENFDSAEAAMLQANESNTYAIGTLTLNNTPIWCEIMTHSENGTPVSRSYTNAFGETVKTCSLLNNQEIGAYYYTYDKNGRNTRQYYINDWDDDVTVASYTYDYAGRVIAQTNDDNQSRTTTYDALGQKITETDFLGNTTTYTYDALGRLIRQEAPFDGNIKAITEYTYDTRGNVIDVRQSKQPDNSSAVTYMSVVATNYDCMGLPDYVSAGNTNIHYIYNYAGRVVAMLEGDPLDWGTDDEHVTLYSYDYWGNLSEITYADGQKDYYYYDAYGNLTSRYLRGDYYPHVYSYDILKRQTRDLLDEDWYGKEGYQYGYDLSNRMIEWKNIGVAIPDLVFEGDEPYYVFNDYVYETETYTYDPLGRQTGETSKVNNQTVVKSYTYDGFGNPTGASITLGGTPVYNKTSTYDKYFRLSTVAQGGKSTAYAYDANGNITSETSGNVVTAYTYNDANLIRTMGTSIGNNTVTDFSYSYYTNGNVRGESSQQAAYTYDYGGRLIEELYGTVNLGTWCDKTYTYDASGNRTQTVCDDSGTVTTVTNTYNIMNQLVSQTDSVSGTKTFTYDTRGNLTNDGTYRYYYDDWSRLQSSCPVNTYNSTSYQYYMNGLRRSKYKSGQGYTYYIWLDGDMVYEFTSNTSHTYTYGHRLLYSDTYNYVLNAHGDVVALLNGSGSVVKRYEYDAFGTEFTPSSTDTNPFRYCAEYFDTESGQIYLRARYYQPRNGRFSQIDRHWTVDNMIYGDIDNAHTDIPAIEAILQSGNLYVYCINNPVSYNDPSGELMPPGLIHNYVLKDIVEKNINLSKERWVSIDAGIFGKAKTLGRVDLVDVHSGEIWELKPENWPRELAEKQLELYTHGKFLATELHDLDLLIGDEKSHKLSGAFTKDIYDIEYRYTYGGIITYSYSVNEKELAKKIETAKSIFTDAVQLTVAIIAAIATTGLPTPMDSPIPVFG